MERTKIECVKILADVLVVLGVATPLTVETPKSEPKPKPETPKPIPEPTTPDVSETPFYQKFAHLLSVKKDLALSLSDSKALWDAMVFQANNKDAFNARVKAGVQPKYGSAQCATTTASVLEGAAVRAGLPAIAMRFNKEEREAKQHFALTHQIEIMLRRLGFNMWDKKIYVAPRGAICLMAGRYDFAGCKQHSGHVFSMYEDLGADKNDVINDNGGFNHNYKHFTESFFLPAGIMPVKRGGESAKADVNLLQIQKELNEHFNAGLKIDGVFGPKTEAAIKKAEDFLKLTVDGQPDSTLQEKLLALKAPDAPVGDTRNPDFKTLWETCIINRDKLDEVGNVCAKIAANRSRYEAIEKATTVPWQIVGCIHKMESGLDFDTHLHNGDSLKARTIQVPKGRPLTGTPPFTWEESAIDALNYDRASSVKSWDIVSALAFLERYNGLGFRNKGIYSCYIWSYTNHYTKGKFVKDGVYDPEVVSKQCGCAAVLKGLKFA